jgi:glutamine cyclotransferase
MKQLFCIALLMIIISCNSNDDPGTSPDLNPVSRPDAPKSLSFSIVNTFPHDTSSFTEGLQIYNGELYEGTGNLGQSKLMKVDLKTGKTLRSVALDPQYFGEGITILRDTVYQLTYQQNTLFMYTLKDFKKIKEIKYSIPAEGWGMTTDGKELIVGDGTNNLYFFEPGTFRLLRTLSISESGAMSYNVNELEYIDGFIYANQWQYPYILKIDPATGVIVGKADFSDLIRRVSSKYPKADYLNGIAYDSATKKIYITGKNWPELYEVQFGN